MTIPELRVYPRGPSEPSASLFLPLNSAEGCELTGKGKTYLQSSCRVQTKSLMVPEEILLLQIWLRAKDTLVKKAHTN